MNSRAMKSAYEALKNFRVYLDSLFCVKFRIICTLANVQRVNFRIPLKVRNFMNYNLNQIFHY